MTGAITNDLTSYSASEAPVGNHRGSGVLKLMRQPRALNRQGIGETLARD